MDIVCKNSSYIFVNVYRALDVSIECEEYCNRLFNCLDYIATLYRNCRLNNAVIAIVGDFNLPDVDWESGLAPDDGVQLKLSKYFFDNGFIQFNNNPTRNGNILDLLFCNDPMFVSHLVTSASFITSDHDSLILSLLLDSRNDTNLTNKSNVWSYDFVNADFQSINNILFITN